MGREWQDNGNEMVREWEENEVDLVLLRIDQRERLRTLITLFPSTNPNGQAVREETECFKHGKAVKLFTRKFPFIRECVQMVMF